MTNEYYPFRADLWTINMNFENSSCITSQTNDELTVYGTFRTKSDITGLYFYSKDYINNNYINYNTIQSYNGITLEFDVETTGGIASLLDSNIHPSIAVKIKNQDMYHYIYYSTIHMSANHYQWVLNEVIPDGTKLNGEQITPQAIDWTNVEYIQFSLFPTNYIADDFTITTNKDYTFRMYNITVSGYTNLGTEKSPITDNSYRLCEGYDDTYYMPPRRLAREMSKLGYKDWNDIYIGASHFYEKTGSVGESARPESSSKVDYTTMTADTTAGLNNAFSHWFQDYVKWFKYYSTPNIVVSVSCECLQMPESWRQLLGNGEYAKTGWVPATYFYDITHQEARNFIELICRQCLDIVVNQGLQPILQWGEPWWWWQELYPESISVNPDNQTTNGEKYPGQPPAFYNWSTKAKYLQETGEELPVYLTSTEEYDLTVINWLKAQLVDYSNFMRGIVKSYPNGLYTVLYFPPSILDVGRVPPMMRDVNFPVEAWNDGQLDFIQLEDYDWVTTDNKAHKQIYDFSQRHFNIPKSKTHYFGGYVQYPNNAQKEWALIIEAMEEAVKNGIGEVYVWAGTQVRRDNIQLHDPVFPDNPVYPIESVSDNTYLNVIIMDEFENVITWLNPDLVDITETNKKETCRKIKIEYPLDKAPLKGEKDWYMQGNKIFVPSTLGIDNCLYVINGEYELDYWKENTVSLEAEEVLTELNYKHIALFEDSIKVTKENLTAWFGDYYTIRNIDKLDTGKTTVSPGGVITLMSLLRLIEEKTERVFITEYVIEDDTVKRYLHLKEEKNVRKVSNTEVLDLNFNLENISFSQDESNTFNAMAPTLSSNNTSTGSITGVTGDSRTSVTATNKTDTKKIYNRWLNLNVVAGEYIPMICEKESDGTVKYTDFWYAPFDKKKGELEITVPYGTESNYNYIKPPNASPRAKCGSVSTSETNEYAIYNVLANSLLDKLNPKLEVEISVKDIQKILKTKNQGYNLYETLYLRAPRFNYYIPCVIVETKKNPHKVGNNTIKVESDITSLHDKKTSHITTNDAITELTDSHTRISGVLATEVGNLNNKLVSISIRLNKADTENTPPATQAVTEINPFNRFIYVTKTDLIEIFNTIENNMIQEGETVKDYYNIISITLDRFKIPKIWYETLFYTYKTGTMGNTFVIHYYTDYTTRFKNTDAGYWLCYYYDYFTSHSGYTALTISDGKLSKAIDI